MEAQLDPITDIFRTVHVTAFGLHRLEATAPWGVKQEKQTEEKVTPSDKKMSPTDLAHFAMLSRGNCWLSVEGIPEPIPLTGGDCFLLARGTSIVLRDSPRTRPRWSFREIGAKADSNVARYGGGGAPTTIICGSLSFDRASLKPITQLLPSFILIKAEQARTLALQNTMQALASEMAEQAPGSEVVATRLDTMCWSLLNPFRCHFLLPAIQPIPNPTSPTCRVRGQSPVRELVRFGDYTTEWIPGHIGVYRDVSGGLPVTRSTCDSRNLFSCQFVLPQHSDVRRQKSCQRCVAREQGRYLG